MLEDFCSISKTVYANPICQDIDMSDSEIEIPKTRGRPFERGQSGNPTGKPRGARNKYTLLAEGLMADAAESMVQIFIEKALDGNMPALLLAMKRFVPPCRERPLQFALPPLESLADAPRAISCIAAGLANGDLTPSEAQDLGGLVQSFVNLHSPVKDDLRMKALEERIAEIKVENEEIKAMFERVKP
jgi:hypothetical protein